MIKSKSKNKKQVFYKISLEKKRQPKINIFSVFSRGVATITADNS